MGKIPVIIVDDDEMDRYIARRWLARDDSFGDIMEANAGDRFLDEYFNGTKKLNKEHETVLVLMDVNMPRMDGFETIEELTHRLDAGKGPASIVVMMFTSSNNPNDIERAKSFDIVKAYINKPLGAEGVKDIREAYFGKISN